MCSQCGIQDVARKHIAPSLMTRPLAEGTVYFTFNKEGIDTVSCRKQEKTTALVFELKLMVKGAGLGRLVLRKQLLRIRGFIIYVVRTHPFLNLYLKRFSQCN